MTEGCMKLIGTEARDSTSVMLLFLMNRSQLNIFREQKSQEFNVYNIAEICFVVRLNLETYIHYEVMSRKLTIAKELAVKLHVVSKNKKPEFAQTFMCAEEWSEPRELGWIEEGNDNFQILITVSVTKPDINMKIYEDEEFTDFKLCTNEGSVAVHKVCLAANSDVLKNMCSGNWKEKTEVCIKMEGVTLQTLKDLKQYLYLGTLPDEGLLPLLLLARCYLLGNLRAECLMKICRTVTSQNLYEILEYSFINDMPELMFSVIETMPKCIVRNANKIMIEKQKNLKRDEKTEMEKESDENNE